MSDSPKEPGAPDVAGESAQPPPPGGGPPADAPEPDIIRFRFVLGITLVVVIVTVVSIIWSGCLLGGYRTEYGWVERPPAEPAPEDIGIVEQTLVLEARRGLDLQRMRRAELDRYEWVDEDLGVARIPIDRAIELRIAEAAEPPEPDDVPPELEADPPGVDRPDGRPDPDEPEDEETDGNDP